MAKTASLQPNIRTVSRVAGVSIATVSRVLNNSPIPSEETCRKVLEAVKSVGYRPDPAFSAAFRRPRKGQVDQPAKTRTIGYLTTPNIQQAGQHFDGYYHDALSSICGAATKNNYYVMFSSVNDNEFSLPGIVAENRVDGLIVQAELSQSLKEVLVQRVPTVFVDRVYYDLAADCVVMDYQIAATEMLSYLWRLGHRRIALFTDTNDRYFNYDIQFAYHHFYASRKLPIPCPELSQPQAINPAINDQICSTYVAALLALQPRPTAILANSNTYLDLLRPFLVQAGLSIAGDISMASLNDQGYGLSSGSAWTSYSSPMAQIGVSAAQLLLQRILTPTLPARKILIHGHMVERASCGPVSVET